ncbi:TenA family transcriptional regulator [Oceanicoccus sp. KOV_DT_Chl]|uniref:TenA family transcriptional regulator n=1 Tax=Oceanicoccus sp. KOV_DT_Chl TaxID=1904639 RepID=UPI000C7BA15B|nr:iron-containing redox enzyme family protein [Oceanicoccus sp. KOV_DT_Chl]
MSFYQTLIAATQNEREYLLSSPLVHEAVNGNMSREHYVAFLNQAYHHVKHTTPLLMAAGSRIPGNKEWLRNALAEYIEEELGHQEWVLNDITACGFDAEKARQSTPNRATELMVAYAYHIIERVNPIGFFGMVHVLEGTSITVADNAAKGIIQATGLPEKAFSYLRSHGALDIEHVAFFKNLMNKIEDKEDQKLIIHCAKNFYHLYADVYRSIAPEQASPLAA